MASTRDADPIGYDTTDPGDRHARAQDGRAPAGDGRAQVGRADHRHPPRRRSDARQGALLFSPRTKDFEWDYKDQPPEFWNQFTTELRARRARPRAGAARLDRARHLALHPARRHPDSEDVFRPQRRRTESATASAASAAGRSPAPVESDADNIDEIIDELAITKTSERAGRAQDHHERNAMQKLRAKGFM